MTDEEKSKQKEKTISSKDTLEGVLTKIETAVKDNTPLKDILLPTKEDYMAKIFDLQSAKTKAQLASDATLKAKFDTNSDELAQKFKNERLSYDDMLATLASLEEGTITSDDFDVAKVKILKVNKDLNSKNNLNVFYYTMANPNTGNDQLLAYNLDNKKASVVNPDLVLGNKVFIYEGRKEGEKVVYTSKKYGLYLDPTVEKVTKTANGRYGPYTYNFFKNNALMKFNPSKPSQTSYIFKSSDIPANLQNQGIKKLGKEFYVYKNMVDVDNSYVNMKGFDSLADVLAGEKTDDKKQVNLIVRLGDNKVSQGKVVYIVKDINKKTSYVLARVGDVYIPSNGKANYKLVIYDKELKTKEDVANGEGDFYYASNNKEYVYLVKEGSDKIWAFNKTSKTLEEVSGVSLAGEFKYDVHTRIGSHGSGAQIDSGTSLGGARNHLNDEENAYFAFNYELHKNVGEAFIFGKFGAYKSSQIFKLTGTSGIKLFDNGDGVDTSLQEDNKEPIKGHVNLVATKNGKIFVELGYFDESCTEKYPSPMMPNAGPKCFGIKYGTLSTQENNKTELNILKFKNSNNETIDVAKENLPYYIARRIVPVAVNDEVFVTLFNGGTSTTGYKYKQYTFNFTDNTTQKQKSGRTYYVKSAKRGNGIYDGEMIIWDQETQTIKDSKGDTVIETNNINGNPGFSIHAGGGAMSGIGRVAMLANNIGGAGHKFELFLMDIDAKKMHYIELAPYSSWIYE
ncbi:MAG: hypothetical protein CSA86_04060 [Arcobacter sp.]|nr:MAG: hypothetical protein CSA86_04060 [Arcobacter sp.]